MRAAGKKRGFVFLSIPDKKGLMHFCYLKGAYDWEAGSPSLVPVTRFCVHERRLIGSLCFVRHGEAVQTLIPAGVFKAMGGKGLDSAFGLSAHALFPSLVL